VGRTRLIFGPAEKKGLAMPVGTVKFFNAQKGYGFITPEDGSQDVFVHITAVEQAGMRTLLEGQRLSFDVVTDQRRGKTNAQNLKAV
jgi:CspA family cold shock protein